MLTGLVPLLAVAAVVHAALLIAGWRVLALGLRSRASWGLVGLLIALLLVSAVEGGLVALVVAASDGRASDLVTADPVRACVIFAALYSVLLGFAALAHGTRRAGASPSMAAGAAMTMAVVALTVSTLPWVEIQGSCRLSTFSFVAAEHC